MNSIEKIMKYEMLTGSIITKTNIVIGVLAFIPALLCFLFTADAFLRSGNSGTDRFPEPAAGMEEKVLFSIASLLLIVFYRYIFINPFSNAEMKIAKQSRLNYWLQVIINNLMALALFIYFMGEHFLPDTLIPKNAFQTIFYYYAYLPFIPLFISSAGCYFNLKQQIIQP